MEHSHEHTHKHNHRRFDNDGRYNCDDATTTEQFIKDVTEIKADLNENWEKIKATLPEDQKVAAEAQVRAVLLA